MGSAIEHFQIHWFIVPMERLVASLPQGLKGRSAPADEDDPPSEKKSLEVGPKVVVPGTGTVIVMGLTFREMDATEIGKRTGRG